MAGSRNDLVFWSIIGLAVSLYLLSRPECKTICRSVAKGLFNRSLGFLIG